LKKVTDVWETENASTIWKTEDLPLKKGSPKLSVIQGCCSKIKTEEKKSKTPQKWMNRVHIPKIPTFFREQNFNLKKISYEIKGEKTEGRHHYFLKDE
jgi:hypothetical protein